MNGGGLSLVQTWDLVLATLVVSRCQLHQPQPHNLILIIFLKIDTLAPLEQVDDRSRSEGLFEHHPGLPDNTFNFLHLKSEDTAGGRIGAAFCELSRDWWLSRPCCVLKSLWQASHFFWFGSATLVMHPWFRYLSLGNIVPAWKKTCVLCDFFYK